MQPGFDLDGRRVNLQVDRGHARTWRGNGQIVGHYPYVAMTRQVDRTAFDVDAVG